MIGVVAVLMLVVGTVKADLIVLDFDDLLVDDYLPSNYAGLNWDPEWKTVYNSVWPYTPSSGLTSIYTWNYGGWIDFSPLGVPVTFEGAYFSGGPWATMHFEGYLGGSLVGISGTLTPTDVPTFLPANFPGPVDYVQVVDDYYNYFTMDDVTFEPVPVPGAILLGILGLSVAGIKLRKFA